MTHLIESIKSYIKNHSENALLLTGEWGSGKTYFVKNALIKELTQDNINCLYISLNGIKNTNELIRQLIASKLNISQNVLIGSSFLKSIVDLCAAIPGLGKIKDINIPANDNIIKLFDFGGCFIIFDDLERLSNDYKLSDFLGFINTEFVEHKGYKVLFVANEHEIKDDKYSLIKEKLIGYTYKYIIDLNDVYESYITKQDTNISWFYEKYKNLIIKLIYKYEIKNLRTIFSAFNCFNHILNILNKEVVEFHHYSIIVFTLSITNEIKLGKITISDIESSKGLRNLVSTVRTKQLMNSVLELNKERSSELEDTNKNDSYEIYYTKKYLDSNPDKYIFYESLYVMLLAGYVPDKSMSEEICIKPALPEWKEAENIMIRYMEHDEETVIINISLVLKYAEKGEYSPFSYGYLYHWLSMFAENNIIKIKNNSLKYRLEKGFKISKKHHGFNYNSFDREYYSVGDSADNPLTVLIDKQISIEKNNDKKRIANGLSQILEDDIKLYEYFEMTKPQCIFNEIDTTKLSKAIKGASARSIFHLCQLVKNRYGFKNIYDYFLPEIEGIHNLTNQLRKHTISKKVYPVKVMAINKLCVELESVFKRLNKGAS